MAYRPIPYALSFHNLPPRLPGQCLCSSGSFAEVLIASLFQNATHLLLYLDDSCAPFKASSNVSSGVKPSLILPRRIAAL